LGQLKLERHDIHSKEQAVLCFTGIPHQRILVIFFFRPIIGQYSPNFYEKISKNEIPRIAKPCFEWGKEAFLVRNVGF
jgi:hypothetical protein